jgi:DNA-binding transcriptional ArsR family regulator
MADLLPSTPDTSAVDDAEPRVIGLDSEDADDLIGALSSGTAREVLTALHEDPATPSKLADRGGTSWGTGDPYLVKVGGTYYLFADKSSNHPYYHVALWTSDTLSGNKSDWTYQGQATDTYGGDPQVVYENRTTPG